MTRYAPVALFVYNRLEYAQRTISYLKRNQLAQETNLYIFSDAPKSADQEKKVNKVREYIESVDGFKSLQIIEAEKNRGLANSIISGVTYLLEQYDKIIVLEDDILTAPQFLNYMNEALEFYKDYSQIWSITGYNYPIKISKKYDKSIYFSYRASSWGWATWKDRWDTVDWKIKDYDRYRMSLKKIRHFCRGGSDLHKMLSYQMKGKIDSWAIRWCYNQSMQNKYTVYPVDSFVSNIGTDGSGTHCDPTSARFNVQIKNNYQYEFEKNIILNKRLLNVFKKNLDRSIVRKIKNTYRLMFDVIKNHTQNR